MMNRQDRAKQFAPFDALKGLREALAKKNMNLAKWLVPNILKSWTTKYLKNCPKYNAETRLLLRATKTVIM